MAAAVSVHCSEPELREFRLNKTWPKSHFSAALLCAALSAVGCQANDDDAKPHDAVGGNGNGNGNGNGSGGGGGVPTASSTRRSSTMYRVSGMSSGRRTAARTTSTAWLKCSSSTCNTNHNKLFNSATLHFQ